MLASTAAPDVVINCVGLTAGGPSELRDANVGAVVKLARALDGRTDVHLIHWGSAAEYGPQLKRATGVRGRLRRHSVPMA
jgi:nucleoside-diphosphate-sugar epimerase